MKKNDAYYHRTDSADLNPEKRNEPSCKNEVVQNLQKRSVQKSTSAQYKKSTEKTYFFGAFLLLCLLAISPKITNFKHKEYIIFGFNAVLIPLKRRYIIPPESWARHAYIALCPYTWRCSSCVR